MGHRVGVDQGRHLKRAVEPLDRLRDRTAFQAARIAAIVERLEMHPFRAVALGQPLGNLPGRILPTIDHDLQLIVGIILRKQQLQALLQERVAAAQTQDDRRLGADAFAARRSAKADQRPQKDDRQQPLTDGQRNENQKD